MELPPPGEFEWSLRGLEEAKTVFTQNRDGRIVLEVRHPVVTGVTAEMVDWWFGIYAHLHIQTVGERLQAFKLWHPRDHISIQRADKGWFGHLKPGDRVTLKETYGANKEYGNTETFFVTKRDREGYALIVKRFGLTVADMRYAFEDTPEGLCVSTRLCVGVADGWAKTLINHFFVPLLFDEKKTEAWMSHNVEEVGAWSHFLPEIFALREQGDVIMWGREKAV
ncbi:MAG: hypothetical protein GY767_15545 [Shimia sp.]|nr:hypothetical protein [Shimia sp.]